MPALLANASTARWGRVIAPGEAWLNRPGRFVAQSPAAWPTRMPGVD